MERICRISGKPFQVTPRDQAFYDKMHVPPPTLCPEEMNRMRLSSRCETELRWSACALTGKKILTYHPEHAPYPVYDRDVWWSDRWDPLEYGKEVDWSRSLLDQIAELDARVPKANIYVVESENSDYTNYATHNKNCYLIFGSWFCQDCYYGNTVYHCTSCVDCHFANRCQWCFECVDCNDCYETAFSQNTQNCTRSWFLFDCHGCENCIGCWNLRGKKYHVWNTPVSKEEFEGLLRRLKLSAAFAREVRERFSEHLQKSAIHRAMIGEANEDVSGNFIYNSRHVLDSYNVQKSEDIAYSDRTMEENDQYFCTGVHFGELAFNSLNVDYSHNVICDLNGEHHTDTAYCVDSHHIQSCFGCVGVRQKKYCILNKQYSKEQYETLVPKIIDHMSKAGEWGEYFPIKMFPFFFNKTLAQDYFPLARAEALRRGYRWKDEEKKAKRKQSVALPDNISDAADNLAEQMFVCEETGADYRLIPQELKLHREMGWPLPSLSWEARNRRRLGLRTPRHLWTRPCMKCGKEMVTTFGPDRPDIVYCENCYLKEVY